MSTPKTFWLNLIVIESTKVFRGDAAVTGLNVMLSTVSSAGVASVITHVILFSVPIRKSAKVRMYVPGPLVNAEKLLI